LITNLLPPKLYLRNRPYPHLHACLLYIGWTCNLHSLWLATYFSGLKECQGIQDVVLMYCQWLKIQHAVILSLFPPIFYLRNQPHPPSAGIKITPGVNIPLGPVLCRGVACRVACAVCKLLKPSLPGVKDVQKGLEPCLRLFNAEFNSPRCLLTFFHRFSKDNAMIFSPLPPRICRRKKLQKGLEPCIQHCWMQKPPRKVMQDVFPDMAKSNELKMGWSSNFFHQYSTSENTSILLHLHASKLLLVSTHVWHPCAVEV